MTGTYEVDYTRQTEVIPGNCYCLLMPFSEVCDHMKIAGTVQHVLCKENGVYLDGGKGPHLTYGEAGIYTRHWDNHPLWGTPHTFHFAYGMKLASADA
jgi:hypothetical protein